MPRRGSAADIRRENLFDVLRGVHARSTASRSEIAAETGLSFATVTSIANELLETGVLIEAAREHGRGRPRARLALNPGRGRLVGVDVAETYVRADLYDLALGALGTAEVALDPAVNRVGDVVHMVGRAVDTVIGTGRSTVLGVGVSVPGQVDPAGGTSVFAPNWNWHDVPLGAALGTELGLPLVLDNPLKAITIAELWSGAGREAGDIVVVNLGTGVGIGIAIGGELHRGATNSAGEWGHTTLAIDGPPCRCGGRGCVEAFVGAPAILGTWERMRAGAAVPWSGQAEGIAALAAALAEGDPVAAAVIDETGRHLGAGLANLVNVLNPELVVLAGWVGAALGPPLLAAVRREMKRQALSRPLDAAELRLRGSDGASVSLGAATFALEACVAGLLEERRSEGAAR
ncbi:ROK family protein [Marinactinospora rubrisoli]|uniref:ROK family protein n=1 Tax=Marinactinospora rubrisoli TaxID=2715399 RepID=A0ABW2K8A7_9ACTN